MLQSIKVDSQPLVKIVFHDKLSFLNEQIKTLIYEQLADQLGLVYLIFVWLTHPHFRPFVITLFLIITTTMILSYLFQQSEDSYYTSNLTKEENLDVREYGNSLTIGYGDIAPKTLIGKLIACITSLWGIIFTSLSLYIFNQHFALTEKEKKELNLENNFENEQILKQKETQQIIHQYQEIIMNLEGIRNKINTKSQLQANQFIIEQIEKNKIIKKCEFLNHFNY